MIENYDYINEHVENSAPAIAAEYAKVKKTYKPEEGWVVGMPSVRINPDKKTVTFTLVVHRNVPDKEVAHGRR